MAINPTTSASSSVTAATTSLKASGQKVISALGSGSGVDVQALAQNLVAATRAPQESLINKKISQNQARISGYGAVGFMIDNLREKFAALDKVSDYNNLSAASSQNSSVQATVTGDAVTGNHTVKVESLVQGQRSISKTSFASPNQKLDAQTIILNINGNTIQVDVDQDSTLSSVVEDLRAAFNTEGVKVDLVKTGISADDPYQLVLTGPAGKSSAFSLTAGNNASPASGIEFQVIQEARDATFYVNGIKFNRPSNTVTDVLPGLSLQLMAPTTGDAGANLQVTRDIAPIKTKINELVSAYNDLNTVLTDASNPTSTVADYGATLVGDSMVESLRRQVRGLFLPATTDPNAGIKSLRDLGISLDKSGKMTVDDKQLSQVLNTRFDEAVSMMTDKQASDTNTLTFQASLPGQARNAVMALTNMRRSYAPLSTQTNNARAQIDQHKADLDRLDRRMTQLLERYNRQFAAMENLLNQTNSLKTSLKGSFDGMAAAYSKN